MSNQPYYAANIYGTPLQPTQNQGGNDDCYQPPPTNPNYQPSPRSSESKQPVVTATAMVLESPVEAYPPLNDDSELENDMEGMNNTDPNNGQPAWIQGEAQPMRFNDVFFGVLFYAHLIIMLSLAFRYIPIAFADLYEHYNDGDRKLAATALFSSSLQTSSIPNTSTIISMVDSCQFLLQFSIQRFSTLLFGSSSLSHDIRILGEGDDYDDKYYDDQYYDDKYYDDQYYDDQYYDDQKQEASNDDFSNDRSTDAARIDANEILFIITISGMMGFMIAGLALPFMIYFAKALIKLTLLWNLSIAILGLSYGIYANIPIFVVLGIISIPLLILYAHSVWSRIPFAAANLSTAVTAIKKNLGLTLHAYTSIAILVIWSILWTLIMASTLYVQGDCNGLECQNEINGSLLFFFLFSYFWTYQVVKNVLHVIIAGTVATWWFKPKEANSFFSPAVKSSHQRAMLYSFGSICFGSLLVAIIEAIHKMIKITVREDTDGILCSCIDCLLSWVEAIAEYFNQWAYVFVAVYGYNFIDASRNVMNLFKTRGWTAIIADHLVDRVLLMVSVGVGVITGFVAFLITRFYELHLDPVGAFILGTFIGFGLTRVLMGVVGSGVNTVIVCYAEAPTDFQSNHPELSNRMVNAWRQTWNPTFHY